MPRTLRIEEIIALYFFFSPSLSDVSTNRSIEANRWLRILNMSPLESIQRIRGNGSAGIVIAVVLGEAIWGFLVSITTNLAVPAMARVMGGDIQSPLYLGKGDFNVQALFTSFLELCFAGIIAVLLNSWSQKPGRDRAKPVRLAPVEARATPVVTPPVRVTSNCSSEYHTPRNQGTCEECVIGTTAALTAN